MFTIAYKWLLRTLGFREPITHTIRRWHAAEPIVFLAAAALEGVFLRAHLSDRDLAIFGVATLQGLLMGHFWWK